MHLFTSRYQRFRPGQGLPVRTTVGAPRYELPYELAGIAKLLMPSYRMLQLDEEPYRRIYRARLDAAGVDAIEQQLVEIADDGDDDRLVLLCFCDLSAPDGWCHRRMFADWWQEQTGQEVPELAEQPIPSLFD